MDMKAQLEEARMVEVLLGTALRRPDVMDELLAFGYGVDDIDHDMHRQIWRLAVEMRRVKATPDPVIIEAKLLAAGVDETEAGAFIGGCVRSVTVEVEHPRLRPFVEQLRQRVALRRIAALAQSMIAATTKAGATATAISATAVTEMDRITNSSAVAAGATGKELADIVGGIIRGESKTTTRHPTHIPGIDELLRGGVPESTIFLLGARTGIGKSTYARFMATHTALSGTPCVYFSTEMNRDFVAPEFLSQICGVDISKPMTSAQAGRVEEARAQMATMPIFFEDQTCMTVEEVTTKIHRYVKLHGVRVVYIDYVQAIEKSSIRADSDRLFHEHISKRLRECCESTRVAMTLMCQVRPRDERATAKNTDDLPSDSEQYLKDASQYATVFRDKNNADITIANESRISLHKNRYGQGALGHGYLQYASGRLMPKERTRNTATRQHAHEEAPDPWT
jgi:replicative DNA helicase